MRAAKRKVTIHRGRRPHAGVVGGPRDPQLMLPFVGGASIFPMPVWFEEIDLQSLVGESFFIPRRTMQARVRITPEMLSQPPTPSRLDSIFGMDYAEIERNLLQLQATEREQQAMRVGGRLRQAAERMRRRTEEAQAEAYRRQFTGGMVDEAAEVPSPATPGPFDEPSVNDPTRS